MKNILVVAPHPDDETLGCGGSILRFKSEGLSVHWLIVTAMLEENGFSAEKILKREKELLKVAELYGFDSVHNLKLPATQLDTLGKSAMVSKVSEVIGQVKPDTLFVPFRNDAHSDHEAVFDAVASSTKSFRAPYVKKIMMYETLSETDHSIKPGVVFNPNVYIDISDFIAEKINIMQHFDGEMGEFPFPRSEQALSALASLRGAQSGCIAAEAFMLLRECI